MRGPDGDEMEEGEPHAMNVAGGVQTNSEGTRKSEQTIRVSHTLRL